MKFIDVKFNNMSFKLYDSPLHDRAAFELQNGTFEQPLPLLLSTVVSKSDGAFLDVGANSGVYTVLASQARQSVKIISFEPLPACIEVLERNIAVNNISSRVNLHRFALSDEAGTATLYLPDPSHGLLESSASLEADFQPHLKSIEVERHTLDELSIAEPISVMKVDIEGHEPAFLRGAASTIAKNRPIIFCEILRNADFDALARFSKEHNLKTYRLRPQFIVPTSTISFDILAWNWALVPEEKASRFVRICRSVNMKVLPAAPEDIGYIAPRRSLVGRGFSYLRRKIA